MGRMMEPVGILAVENATKANALIMKAGGGLAAMALYNAPPQENCFPARSMKRCAAKSTGIALSVKGVKQHE